jgi:hypothetical protein
MPLSLLYQPVLQLMLLSNCHAASELTPRQMYEQPAWPFCSRNASLLDVLQAAAYGNDSDVVMFTGEMVFPWMFEDLAALRPMKGLAELLAQQTTWTKLYDADQLQSNEVPVVAATYVEDMYVDFNLAQATAAKIKGIRQWMTNEYQHSALPSQCMVACAMQNFLDMMISLGRQKQGKFLQSEVGKSMR